MTGFDLDRRDTICALATPAGSAAIAVLRASGRDAEQILARVFRRRREGAQRPFVATLGVVFDASAADPEAAPLDEALCVFFPGGQSYTGEPTFELSVHGGRSRVQSVLRSLVAAGCRLAEPGEFTLRAVLTGRLDLAAAEAVHDLVQARTDEAARVALRQLQGGLGERLESVRTAVVDVLAEVEARLDFPDEELGESRTGELLAQLDEATLSCTRLLESVTLGRRLREGARVVLYGLPNAGKSTLLNALLGETRALVHESPGTTRDVLEAEVEFVGIPVVLVDVAGVRDTTQVHPVEALGIERAERELARADLQLLVVDSGSPTADDEVTMLRQKARPDALVVRSKAELREGFIPDEPGVLAVSAHTAHNLDELRRQIATRLGGDSRPALDEVLLSRERQREEVHRLRQGVIEAAIALRHGLPHEVVSSELRSAGAALDRLLGRSLTEDVLDVVFSRFCIGK
ncbi:MAG: tRNA uridine-5-carboxymethylaminomethyl(34) synthesis GTPase MnmE [Myxococcota bacterium]